MNAIIMIAAALIALSACSPLAILTNPWTNAQLEHARIQCLKADKVWIETQETARCVDRTPL